MTAPISNGPTTTRLHHYAGHYCEIIRPARTGAGVNAKKFAQRTINDPKMAFYGLLGELFRGSAREVGCWANFFAEFR